jgi:hypothetical protein
MLIEQDAQHSFQKEQQCAELCLQRTRTTPGAFCGVILRTPNGTERGLPNASRTASRTAERRTGSLPSQVVEFTYKTSVWGGVFQA